MQDAGVAIERPKTQNVPAWKFVLMRETVAEIGHERDCTLFK